MPEIPENQVNREEEWMAYLGGAGDVPQGAPYNRMEEWFLYMGGDGDEPNGGPLNRLEEWYAWMAENGGGGGGGGSSTAMSDVNFIDYDGDIPASYTAEEFLALTALPENPSHDGLAAQGWNWSLADAQDYVTKYGKLNIGQMYTTVSGATEIDITLGDYLSPYLGIAPNGTVVIDWGDGSDADTVTGTGLTTLKFTNHTYAAAGNYTISLTVTSGSFAFYCSNQNYGAVLSRKNSFYNSRLYSNTVRAIRIGSGASIGARAFACCDSLESVTIPNGATSIGDYAFAFCYALASATIPSGATIIASSTFQDCQSLKSAAIPKGITIIESYAFQNCYALESVAISDGVITIGNLALGNCYALTLATIPNSVTSIGASAFSGCCSLRSIAIPEGVTSIGNNAFSSCYSLRSATIPEGVTVIDNYAFQYGYALISVTIPESVTRIGSYAFSRCYSATEFHFLPTTPPTLGSTNAFTDLPTDCVFYVPAESLAEYQAASNWSSYASRMVGE